MKNEHPMSVFAWYYPRWYWLRHPFRSLRWLRKAIRERKLRAVYGWCDGDTRDWYNWTAHVLSGLLRDISMSKDMPEKNRAKILGVADDIWLAVGDTTEADEFNKECVAVLTDKNATAEEKIAASEACNEKRKALEQRNRELIAKAFTDLGNMFFDFWRL